jgi:hypothetical protein
MAATLPWANTDGFPDFAGSFRGHCVLSPHALCRTPGDPTCATAGSVLKIVCLAANPKVPLQSAIIEHRHFSCDDRPPVILLSIRRHP